MKFEKSCGAVIFIEENEIEFLAVRSKAHGHWGFPKGHVEEGESEHETAVREVYEETGLNVGIFEEFRTQTEYSTFKNVQKEVIFFLAKVSDRNVKIQHSEIQDYKWASFNDMLRLLTFENDRKVLTEAYNFLQNKSNI